MPSKTSGFTTALVVYISVMINSHFISFSAVQIYDLSYIHLHCSFSTGTLRTHKVNRSLDSSVGNCTAPVSQRSWARVSKAGPAGHRIFLIRKISACGTNLTRDIAAQP